jgi:Fe-S oxidoreductase
VKNFITRKMLRQAQFGLADIGDEAWWICSTCGECVRRCPRGVDIIAVIKAVRNIMVRADIITASLRATRANIAGVNNPYGEAREKRADWAQDFSVKMFTPDTELLYFSCCVPAYDPVAKDVARATASILKKAGVDFGILGDKESCCGESIRKAGDEELFQTLARRNIEAFAEAGVKKVLVSSPHCYHTFKNEYPDFGANFEVIHFTQFLLQLIKDQRLTFTKELNKRVTYHDPCYLGRHNGIYDEPRQILQGIPGLELVEMRNSRENSFCCGGGGGGVWQETKKGERLSDLRLEQAIEAGAEVLAVACPYCMLMFKDSVLTMDKVDAIEVKDVAELVAEAI